MEVDSRMYPWVSHMDSSLLDFLGTVSLKSIIIIMDVLFKKNLIFHVSY